MDWYAAPRTAWHGGMLVAGLGGVTGRTDKPNRMPEADYLRELQGLLRKGPRVLMLHQGPDVPIQTLPGHGGIRINREISYALRHAPWE
ncbi:hypothetical protein [Paenibacillus jiagnxiensis]|uniref:hypothetical protein n=1 Tax=Paenibacillus jiagnxiensis TaxID=3228926 RepID=UPI00339F25FF